MKKSLSQELDFLLNLVQAQPEVSGEFACETIAAVRDRRIHIQRVSLYRIDTRAIYFSKCLVQADKIETTLLVPILSSLLHTHHQFRAWKTILIIFDTICRYALQRCLLKIDPLPYEKPFTEWASSVSILLNYGGSGEKYLNTPLQMVCLSHLSLDLNDRRAEK